MSAPVQVDSDTNAVAALAGLASNRCLMIAKALEADAAIDYSLVRYSDDLARGLQHLIDVLPDAIADDLRKPLKRLELAVAVDRSRRAA